MPEKRPPSRSSRTWPQKTPKDLHHLNERIDFIGKEPNHAHRLVVQKQARVRLKLVLIHDREDVDLSRSTKRRPTVLILLKRKVHFCRPTTYSTSEQFFKNDDL